MYLYIRSSTFILALILKVEQNISTGSRLHLNVEGGDLSVELSKYDTRAHLESISGTDGCWYYAATAARLGVANTDANAVLTLLKVDFAINQLIPGFTRMISASACSI